MRLLLQNERQVVGRDVRQRCDKVRQRGGEKTATQRPGSKLSATCTRRAGLLGSQPTAELSVRLATAFFFVGVVAMPFSIRGFSPAATITELENRTEKGGGGR